MEISFKGQSVDEL